MSIKIVTHANTVKRMMFLVGLTLTVAAVLFMLIEGASLLDGFYWASTTMTSVGYGDISPATALGKIMTIVFQIWSMFVLLPLAVWNIINMFDTSAFTHREQEWVEDTLKRIAAAQNVELSESPSDHDCY